MFNIVENKMCPFCHTALRAVNTPVSGKGIFYYFQCGNHLEIGYNSYGKWYIIRVSPLGFGKPTFYASWLSASSFGIKATASSEDTAVSLPEFPLFNYSLAELADKIKTYISFS